MELVFVATLAILATILAAAAFAFSVFNFIQLKAQGLSTHTVLPISPDSTMEKIEKQLTDITKVAGGSQADLNRNLFDAGIDPEDLV